MQVTTTAGATINFDPARVFMLTGPLPTDTTAVFYLHGVAPRPIPQLSGTMAAFVATMPNAKNFVQLTFAKTGGEFYANAKVIHVLGALSAAEQTANPKANAVISLGNKYRYISESVAAAKSAIDGAGGSI